MNNDLYKEKTGNFSQNEFNEEPGLYQVTLHHDDFTARHFVLEVLEKHFYMDRRQAAEVMLKAQELGKAVCGKFTKDIAATKIETVMESAISKEFPLVCSMEAA